MEIEPVPPSPFSYLSPKFISSDFPLDLLTQKISNPQTRCPHQYKMLRYSELIHDLCYTIYQNKEY